MQAKFSQEIYLVNKLRTELIDKGWAIIQLVCSGGQAHFSVTYKSGVRNKTIFPDLVAHKGSEVLIGEVKELFNNDDHGKLLELLSSEIAESRIKKNVSIRTKRSPESLSLKFILINSDVKSLQPSELEQLVFHENEFKLKNKQLEYVNTWW